MGGRVSDDYFNTLKPELKRFHSVERYTNDDGSSEDQENKINIS
jgi:hypothetical protein